MAFTSGVTLGSQVDPQCGPAIAGESTRTASTHSNATVHLALGAEIDSTSPPSSGRGAAPRIFGQTYRHRAALFGRVSRIRASLLAEPRLKSADIVVSINRRRKTSFGFLLWHSFLATFGPVVGVLGLLGTFVTWQIRPDVQIAVGWVVLVITLLVVGMTTLFQSRT